ncbi:LytR/AlgR family response regulator transcription factor [Flavobacterium rhizosphaerae]|uniref:LytTR family DNA-binding domain-containing protein n=1 Tax=Flavobacterium rhizosphaerae TaxID=3163298 RepID=A0ABW8YY93_9FLAO
MQYFYLIIDDSPDVSEELILYLKNLPGFKCLATTSDKEEAVNLILEHNPKIVFLNLSNKSKNDLNFGIITELYQYLNDLPAFIVLSDSEKHAFQAIKAGVFDYLLKPLEPNSLRKSVYRYVKLNPGLQTDIALTLLPPEDQEVQGKTEQQRNDVDIQVCIKSYGDYQFIALKDVVYLKADNNTTDFYLQNGKSITAYKTLKHYENNLPPFFYRIHNSYIVNSNYVSRINTGKSLCYLSEIDISVPFSKTFKESVDAIIRNIAPEYL